MKYGTKTKDEPDREWREFVKEVVIDTVIVVLIFVASVIFMCSISGCSLTLNIAADGRPVQVIYNDDSTGKME